MASNLIKTARYLSLTDEAWNMLDELAEHNGLERTPALEVLIRQAWGAKWRITSLHNAQAVSRPGQDVYLRDTHISTRLMHLLMYNKAFTPEYTGLFRDWPATIQQLANFGEKKLKHIRGLGPNYIGEARRLCETYGYALAEH